VVAQIPQLRCYAHSLTREPERAQDLVQDCLQRAFEKLHLWKQGTNMRAWLFTIMHNIHANAAKRFNTGPQFVSMEQTEHLNNHEPVLDHKDDALIMQDLEAALRLLSSEHREIIYLVCIEELKYNQVASILDLPLGTVMSRLYRAREQLRQHLYGDSKNNVRRLL